MSKSGIVCILNLTKLKGFVKLIEIAAPRAENIDLGLGKYLVMSVWNIYIEQNFEL